MASSKIKSSGDSGNKELRILLVGRSGSGKSATGNAILGIEKQFKTSALGKSKTKKCTRGERDHVGKWDKIVVVDTPGVFDTDDTVEKTTNEITKFTGILSPGPHVIILVLRMGVRYTKEEEDTVKYYVRLFGEEIFKHWIVLFTCKDALDEDEMTFNEFLSKYIPRKMKSAIKLSEKNCIAMENKPKNKEEKERDVKKLLTLINGIVEANGDRCYTNKTFEMVQELNKRREQDIREKLEEEAKKQKDLLKEEMKAKLPKADAKKRKDTEREYDKKIRDVDRALTRKTNEMSLKAQVRDEYEKETGIWEQVKDVTKFIWELVSPLILQYIKQL